MLLNYFNSYFEVFAVFNFAYVISDTFNSNLNEKVIRSFGKVRHQLDNIKSQIKVSKESVFEIKAIKNASVDSSAGLHDAILKIGQFENELQELDKTITTDITKSGIRPGFVFICLFAALYCLSVILISGIQIYVIDEKVVHATNKLIFDETFLIFNSLISLFLIYLYYREEILLEDWKIFKGFEIGYVLTIGAFSICLLLSLTWFLFDYWILSDIGKISLIWINSSFALIIPAAHFIIYFVIAVKNAKRTSVRMKSTVLEFEQKYQNFQKKELERLVQFHSDYLLHEIKQKVD